MPSNDFNRPCLSINTVPVISSCLRLGLRLHAELFEVQVALDAAQDVVADLVVIPQIDDRVALGLDHRVANGAVIDQLLLGSRGSVRPTPAVSWRSLAVSGRSPIVEVAGAVGV